MRGRLKQDTLTWSIMLNTFAAAPRAADKVSRYGTAWPTLVVPINNPRNIYINIYMEDIIQKGKN